MSFHDAEILAFPAPTMAGPRWITTPALLDAAGCAAIPPLSVNALGLTNEVGIKGANHDTGMFWDQAMQLDEMFAIKG